MTREQEETIKLVHDQHPDVQALPYFRDGLIVLIQDDRRVYVLGNGALTEKLDG